VRLGCSTTSARVIVRNVRPAAALVTAVLVTFVAGCSWAGEAQELPDGTHVLVSGPRDGGEDALLPGRLEVVDGCLGVSGQVVVWPHGTEVAPAGEEALVLPSGELVPLGGEVELGGGSFAWDELPGAAPTVPEQCRAAGEVWLAAE